MKRTLVVLVAVFLCSVNALGQTSVATIGRAITQCNDFEYAKLLLTSDGLIIDETTSNKNYAKFYNPKAQHVDKALFVEIYKLNGNNKIEKCVITFYNVNFLSDCMKVGYKYCNPEGLSIEPFQALYEADKYAMGLNNKRGWLIATFFRFDQEVDFEHLEITPQDNEENNKEIREYKVDLNDIFSLGANDPIDYNYTELDEEGFEYLDSLGIYWSDNLQSWATKNIKVIDELDRKEDLTNSKESELIIYSIVETPPEFVGGNDALWKYLLENTKYPKDAKENGSQGMVIVQFIINEDGSVSNVETKNVLYKSLEEEAIRVISSMPKWNPGTINGNPVKVKYTIPINFELN
jgi:protein TonB